MQQKLRWENIPGDFWPTTLKIYDEMDIFLENSKPPRWTKEEAGNKWIESVVRNFPTIKY